MGDAAGQAGAVAKVCVRCGVNCAGRPRTKDARGRYVCGECVGAIKAARLAAEVGAPAPIERAPDAAAPAPGAAAHAPGDERISIEPEDDGAIPLADDSAIPLEADPLGLSEPAGGPNTCRGCGLLLAAHAVVCTSCGFDARTNTVHAGPAGAGPRCFKCGYSLAGLKARRCPECGEATMGRERMLGLERKHARDAQREAYTKPLMMFAIGVAISGTMLMLLSGGLGAGLGAILVLMVKYAIYVPFGVLAFLGCCLLWIGFNAPIHLTALRLAGIYAVADATAVIVFLIPIPIIPWLIFVTVYIGLLQDMLELDLIDAVAVGLITFITRSAVPWIVAEYAVKALGL